MKIVFNTVPDFSQSMGFKHKKGHNEQSKDDLLQWKQKTHGRWKNVDQQTKEGFNGLGYNGHEYGTKYGPQYASIPPTIIIARYLTLSIKGKCSGVMVFKKFTHRQPEIPAIKELMAKA